MAGFEPATAASSGPMALNINSTPHILAWLPEGAADRLRALRQHSADLNALIPATFDRLAAANAKMEAEQRLARLRGHQSQRGGGFNLPDSDSRVVAARELLDKLTADHARISDLYEIRAAAYASASQTLGAVQMWLRDGGRSSGTTLEDHGTLEPKLNKGESLMDGIERHRRRVRELQADLHRIQSSPYPSSHCKQRVREMIEEMSARGQPSLSALVEYGRDMIGWPTQMVQVTVHNAQGASGFAEVADTVAMFAWLHKDALIKRLDAEVDAEADDKSALTHDVRQRQEAVVMGDLLSVERDECALVWQAQAQRLPVEHRSDVNSLALLGLSLIAAPAVSSGTSPGYSFHLRR